MKKTKSEILKKIHGGQICQIIGTCCRLGVFNLLHQNRLSAEQVSTKLSIHYGHTRMLLLALESLHLVISDDNETFYLSEEGSYLAKNHEDSLEAIAIYKSSKPVWKSLEHLQEGIEKNKCPFELAFGIPLYDYLDIHDEDFSIFHEAMALYEKKSSKKILDLADFTQFSSIIDIGGGLGSFLEEILERAPLSKGALLDRPKVINLLKEVNPDLSSRIELYPGDFFQSLPKGYSLYVLRNIIHNWDDEKALIILENIARIMDEKTTLMIFETLIKDEVSDRLGKFATINMFAMNSGGKERSLTEIDLLLKKSGLVRKNLVQTTGSKSLIEVIKK